MKLTSSQIKNTSVVSGTTVADSLNTLHTLVGGGGGGGDMFKNIYDTNNNGKVDISEAAEEVPWAGVTDKPTEFNPSSHNHSISEVANLQTALDNKQDDLVSNVNIKTINGESLLGSGDLVISGGGGGDTAANIHAAPSKTTPADADELGYLNSAAGFDLVKMTWANIKSALLSFTTSGAGAATRTLGDKVSDIVSPLDFGAVGNGSTDDTAALQLALDGASGRVIDLLGKTYKVTSSLAVPSNTTLVNGVLDGSTMANADTMLEAYGTLGSAVSMSTTSARAGSFVVSSATGISANTILYLESTTIFGSGATKNGELIKTRSVSGTTVTPYRRVYDYYLAGQQFYKPTMKRNITLRNLRLIGGGNGLNHVAFHALLCENVVVEHCHSTNFGDRHFQVQRCLNARFTANHMEHSDDATGLSYGIVVANGCDMVTITGCTGIDMRHAVTIGAENGVDRHVAVTGCTFTGCTDSPIDTHSQAQYVTITGNTCGADSTLNSQDGLVVQGTDCVVTGNVVTGFDRVGILLQPLCVNNNFGDTTTCTGNIVTASSAGAVDAFGLFYDNQRTGGLARVNISGNTINMPNAQGYGINFEIAAGGSTVAGLVMNNNNVYARRTGIRILTAANKFLRSSVIVGNSVETLASATYDAIEVTSTTANYIERLMIAANSTYGGRYGINVANVSRVAANSNMLQAFATAATNGTFVATADNYTT